MNFKNDLEKRKNIFVICKRERGYMIIQPVAAPDRVPAARSR